MPSFDAGGALRAPFGKNQYLASTHSPRPTKVSYTFSMTGIPTEDIDGNDLKVLQPGTVLAVITAATAEQDKVGVYDTGATDGRQTASNIVGICDTFVPWQLEERDVEVAVTVAGQIKQAWCFHYDTGVRTADIDAAGLTAIGNNSALNLIFR